MKRQLFRIWTAVWLIAAAAISCTGDPDVDRVGLVSIGQESLTADGAGEELTLDVASNAYWHIEFTDPATGETVRWITASETYGTGDASLKLIVARNRSTSPRTAHIRVTTDSESSTATILLSQGAGTVGGGDGYGFPIYQMFSIDDKLMLSNAFIEGGTCYFDDGMILSRTGSPAEMTFSTQTHTNPKSDWYFQRGVVIGSWETGDALQLEIPLKESLSGDLRYVYGSRRDGTQNASHAWVFEWSSDGAEWTPFDGASEGGCFGCRVEDRRLHDSRGEGDSGGGNALDPPSLYGRRLGQHVGLESDGCLPDGLLHHEGLGRTDDGCPHG